MISIELALPAFIIGVLLLWKGSDVLVEGTSRTAIQLGISSLIISVVVVGFGTSAPEFAVSIGAAINNNSDISFGNIIGSCVANLLLVLGLSACIKPIKIKPSIVRREYLLVCGATFILLISSYLGLLDTYRVFGGIIFLILFVAFVTYFIICAKKERDKKIKIDKGKTQRNIILMILGIIGVIIGAWLIINSSITIAEYLGISTFIIALSMVALGTSIPELVVSSMAAYKQKSDIAVGNVLGSNVFNILLILGFAALFIPLNANTSESMMHLWILLFITLIMFPIFYTKNVISKKEGIFMISIYLVFLWYIFFGHTLFF